MGKYYARPINGENYNWENWYDEEQAVYDNLWAGGNRDFGDINGSLRSDLVAKISNVDSDIYNSFDSLNTEKQNDEEACKILYYYFPKAEGNEDKYIDLIDRFEGCRSYDENKILCELLELETGEPYITGTFNGYSQGDWMEYICPKRLEDSLGYIGAAIMGTGTEFEISVDKLESEEEFEDARDKGDTEVEFTNLWSDDDIKQWIADIRNCAPEDVELLEGDY